MIPMLYAIKFSFRVVVAVTAAMTAEELLVSPDWYSYRTYNLNNRLMTLHRKSIPYSGLFSRGVNFPEFPEWTRDSGNFILDC